MESKKSTKKIDKKKRKIKKVLSSLEKDQLKRKSRLRGNIRAFYKALGFEYIATDGIQKNFANIPGDLDSVFIYENIILLSEQTISSSNDHIRTKHDYFQKILSEKNVLIDWLKKVGSAKFKKFDTYQLSRYHIFYIYVTESTVEEEIRNRYPEFKYLGPKSLKYFLRVATTIKYSARNEFFKYLGLSLDDIGSPSSSVSDKTIDSAVIMPESSSGFPQGIHVVSFVMKAKELLDCAYVFRKDNWENRVGQYYQRLIDKRKIERIRNYLAKEERTFIDNIVVSLPEGTLFSKSKNEQVDVSKIATITNVQIRIPYKINSIGIIDGQHRVFGHYEGIDHQEKQIAVLREKRHLFVTGIFYEENKFDDLFKRTFESSLFLLMNSTHNRVGTDLLQYIETLKAPLSPIGVAGNVLMKLNDRSPFLNYFRLSPLDNEGIRTPTIVKFGLQGLVEMTDKKETLFKYWDGRNKQKLVAGKLNEEAYNDYIKFCVSSLSVYFSAVREKYPDKWNFDKEFRLLTSTAIVAFLKSFSTSLAKYGGVQNHAFYTKKLQNLSQTFTKQSFAKFGSSHWPTLASKIDAECWK